MGAKEAFEVVASLTDDSDDRLLGLAADFVVRALGDMINREHTVLDALHLSLIDRVLASPSLPRAKLPVRLLEVMTADVGTSAETTSSREPDQTTSL